MRRESTAHDGRRGDKHRHTGGRDARTDATAADDARSDDRARADDRAEVAASERVRVRPRSRTLGQSTERRGREQSEARRGENEPDLAPGQTEAGRVSLGGDGVPAQPQPDDEQRGLLQRLGDAPTSHAAAATHARRRRQQVDAGAVGLRTVQHLLEFERFRVRLLPGSAAERADTARVRREGTGRCRADKNEHALAAVESSQGQKETCQEQTLHCLVAASVCVAICLKYLLGTMG